MNSTTSRPKKLPLSKEKKVRRAVSVPPRPPSLQRDSARRKPSAISRQLPAKTARRQRPAGIETATGLVPLWVAESVLNEAEVWLHSALPAEWPAALATKAERCFAGHRQFHRLVSARTTGIANLRKFMRHWLSGLLLRTRPVLYRRLPDSFHLGLPLRTSHAGS